MRDVHFGFWACVWPRSVTRMVVTAICQPRGRPLAGGAEIRNPELSAHPDSLGRFGTAVESHIKKGMFKIQDAMIMAYER